MISQKRKIIISAGVAGLVSGGLFISGITNSPTSMSMDDYNDLLRVYNYEISKAGGKITIGDKNNPVTKDNVIKMLDQKLLNSPDTSSTVSIGQKNLTPTEYQALKLDLFTKAEK